MFKSLCLLKEPRVQFCLSSDEPNVHLSLSSKEPSVQLALSSGNLVFKPLFLLMNQTFLLSPSLKGTECSSNSLCLLMI